MRTGSPLRSPRTTSPVRIAAAGSTRREILQMRCPIYTAGTPRPKEVVELLRELACPCVFGNSADFLLTLDCGAEPVDDEERRQRLLETADWSRGQLRAEGLDFLRGFQPTVQSGDVLCCHATP